MPTEEEARVGWIEFPELLNDEAAEYLRSQYEEHAIRFRLRSVMTGADLLGGALAYVLLLHTEDASQGCWALRDLFQLTDPDQDVPQTGTCPACETEFEGARRCPSCGINFGLHADADDPKIEFVRACGGFQDRDVVTLKWLAESGIDLSRPIPVRFYMRAPDQAAAEAIATDARSAGLPARAVEDDGWQCTSERTIIATFDAIVNAKDELADIAARHGGAFWWWEADRVECDVAHLVADGRIAGSPTEFTFDVECGSKSTCDSFWFAARNAGYVATVASDDDGAPVCRCVMTLPLAVESIGEAHAALTALAEPFEGWVAGWRATSPSTSPSPSSARTAEPTT